jgi:hypothetical protein
LCICFLNGINGFLWDFEIRKNKNKFFLTSNVVATGQDVKGRKMWRNGNGEREKDIQIERQTDEKDR